MLIRSQDKMVLIPIDTGYICVNYRTKKDLIFCGLTGNDENCLTIGKYSSEEKAIKVLDMIQEKYGTHYYGTGGPLATSNHYVPPFGFNPPKVFQMLQDSEVEV